MKKIVIGIVAENNAGKSTAAGILIGIGAVHYSVREIIRERHKKVHNGEHIQNTRVALKDFSQSQKNLLGAHTFIEEAVQQFCSSECVAPYAVIESLRAPGEALWLRSLKQTEDFQTIIIGVTAPYEDRLSRFLQGGMGEIAGTLTEDHFKHHESLARGGITQWEENVPSTLTLSHSVFENPNGALSTFKKKIINYVQNVDEQKNKTFTSM